MNSMGKRTNKKIKIIHIAQAQGGVEKYLKMFFKYLPQEKYDNQLIVSKQYIDSKDYFEELGIKVHIVDMKREISVLDDLKAMFKIFEIIKIERPNIVYTHSSKAGGLGRIPAKLFKCKNIYNPHGWSFDMDVSKKKKIMFKIIEKYLTKITDNIIAISNYEKQVAINNNIDKDKIVVIENGIDFENVQLVNMKEIISGKLGWDKKDIIVGMVARVDKQKSPETFINIAELLIKERPDCKFIMVGDGEKRSEIEKMIKEKKLDKKIYITGWINNAEDYISAFDIALLTSKWEGFGLVIPEYMAHKKVVVASNVGGISNIIDHNETGFLVDDLNVKTFVKYILELLDNEENKNKIVKQAFKKAENKYDFKRVIHQHIEIYNKLL